MPEHLLDGCGNVLRTFETDQKPRGAWLVYVPDYEIDLVTLEEDEDVAMRKAAEYGDGAMAIFWEFGKPWSEVELKHA